uniref:Ycf22 n=1 Tax=Pterocladia lucida TaxID=31408 RepID=A0A6M3WW96_PTELU|nr:Ycf22 [Pterocladia lucida]
MRGISVGYVQDLKLGFNTVIVLVNINSTNIFIPKNSIIETSQTGILKDAIIDIIPLEVIKMSKIPYIDHFSNDCYMSKFLCNYHHLYGERGINYDDLIRATTRISQRFDDPRFFNLCYLLLQRLINVSYIMLDLSYDIKKALFLFSSYISQYLIKN